DLERELTAEERRLKDVARSIADRREGLARLNGQVNAARSRAARDVRELTADEEVLGVYRERFGIELGSVPEVRGRG
ncbi:hypothetical protein, partial [Streptomyces sp. Agncl-13]|uniref:hypothetical protein n=1 Tax=Streptomyces sp. Agncl-13 TaxID=3400628 RepID=UPI003A87ED94